MNIRPARSLRRQKGVGLFDGLVALAILAFGLLGLSRFQTKLVSQSTEAQNRTVAAQLADELLNTMLVDNGNAACYTAPQTGTCGSTAAAARMTAWRARLASAPLPNVSAASSSIDANGRMTVQINWVWTSKDAGNTAADTRTHIVVSDIR